MVNRKNPEQLLLRLPAGMKDQLKVQAQKNERSLSAEVVSRLESNIDRDEEGAFKIWLPQALLDRILHQAREQEEDPNALIEAALERAFPDTESVVGVLWMARQKMEAEMLKQRDPQAREYGEYSIRQIDEMIAVAADAEGTQKRQKAQTPFPTRKAK